ncbi:MAG: DUF4142 domain-containing protein [Cellvibrionaceae bacterium]
MKVQSARLYATVTTAILATITAACSMPSKPMIETAAEASKPFSSGEILQVLQTLNEAEIEQARLAEQRSQTEEVREAAELIIDHHTSAVERIDNIARDHGIALEESPLSRGLESQSSEIRQELAALSGSEFDCVYLQKQVEQHRLALDTVHTDLLPDAELRPIRETLGEMAPQLEQHQRASRQVIANLPECDEP